MLLQLYPQLLTVSPKVNTPLRLVITFFFIACINISSRESYSYTALTLAGSVFTIRSKNSFTSEITASDISTPKMLTLLYKFSGDEECNSST
jgi:hypothetical protein